MFVNAIEESAINRPVHIQVEAKELESVIKIMENTKRTHLHIPVCSVASA